jgi:hypothetical protein
VKKRGTKRTQKARPVVVEREQLVHFADRPTMSNLPSLTLCGYPVQLSGFAVTRMEKNVTCHRCKTSLDSQRWHRRNRIARGAKPSVLHYFKREADEQLESYCGRFFGDHEDRVSNEIHEVTCTFCRTAWTRQQTSQGGDTATK